MRSLPAVALTTSIVTAAAVAFGGAATAAPQHPHPAPAAVSGAARHGGAVIVTLRQQFHGLAVNARGAQRRTATRSSQRGVVSDITRHGGTHIVHLDSVNAVAARMPAAEVRRLRRDPDVASIERDMPMHLPTPAALPAANVSQQLCPSDPSEPLLEPEALGLTHFESQPARPSDADTIATGRGVKVGLTGINALAGNPNFIRPNGQHVVIDSPTPDADDDDFDGGGDEWYGDASTVAGQGTVTYDFSRELPYSHLPAGCTFRIEGISPGVSLVDTGYFGQGASRADGAPTSESQAIAGLDTAAAKGVSVVSESYGYDAIPGRTDFSSLETANDELVASGITVVESSGDSGVGGTVEQPANDPLVIDAGATNSMRLQAQAWGFTGWENNQMTPLSSGGTTPNNNVVDLVAPGYGGEANCSPQSATCPQDTLTEAFGGTSESAPFIAGAAADVIQAYADSHRGTKPSPALVKQILCGTAQDFAAPADEQGAGLLDVGAAVRAAQQQPGSSVSNASRALVPAQTQLNVRGNGGRTVSRSVVLYNASSSARTVTSRFRGFSAPQQLGATVTEPVTVTPPSRPYPAVGATAAAPVSMTVPSGLAQLGVDMITPNPRNNAVLTLLLFDPQGRLSQVSYDYSEGPQGPVSNNEHVEIARPEAGRWTARIYWNNGRAHLQDPPPQPGRYRGDISVRFTGEHAVTSPAASPVTIAAHSRANVALPIALPSTPGDAPESVQFSSSGTAPTSVPITRRTLIPSGGGSFRMTLGSSVARGFGPLQSMQFVVPAGQQSLHVRLHTDDVSPDNRIDYFLVSPNGVGAYEDSTPGRTFDAVGGGEHTGDAELTAAEPKPGLWTVQSLLELTTSGKEFTQAVDGTVSYGSGDAGGANFPDSPHAQVPANSSTPVHVTVTNTLGTGRRFSLTSSNLDVSGNPVYIAPGASVVVNGLLHPTAQEPVGSITRAAATVLVSGYTESARPAYFDGLTFLAHTFARFPIEYQVAPASSG